MGAKIVRKPSPLTWFARGDLDGFFGLFVDNLLQLMLIVILGKAVCGFSSELLAERILPGAGLSILFGNVFYAWQARRLMARTGRDDVTALPYGINTVSLFAFIFLIMGPVYRDTGDARLAWQVGLFACLVNAVMEIVGAFCGDWLRRNTPRAALLSTLAGIALTFIAMGFVFRLFASPALGLVPMLLILVSYASKLRPPFGLPGGLTAVALGTLLAWLCRWLGFDYFQPLTDTPAPGFYPPVPVPGEALGLLADPAGWSYMAVIVPMALFNLIGSLQNLESAEAAGDRYETRSSLLANGLGSLVAALFGSAFPTTIYIGHPGWKALGARAGYSSLNGVVIAVLCMIGGYSWLLKLIPLEAALGILLWIGLIIMAQAFQAVPRSQALAVSLGIVPALASWALLLIETAVRAAGSTLYAAAPKFGQDLYIHGIIALSQGFMLTSMILAAVLVFIIEGKFLKAAAWVGMAAVLSYFGLIHAYALTPLGVENSFGLNVAPEFAATYGLGALVLLGFHWHYKTSPAHPDAAGGRSAIPRANERSQGGIAYPRIPPHE
jgi:AGZA family xanthine/uracil permease-like MFS transporter